jgi:RNA polymerase sigma-70 factor, ECF subfamily
MTISTEQTWQEMNQQLRGFFRRRVRDDQLAEDLLQETFLRIHNGLASLEEREHLGAWVYRIARNTLVDYLRKGSTSREVPTDDLTLAEGALAEGALEEATHEDVAHWLRHMVQRLPAKYQAAVELAELDGISQREMSERLGISLSGAKSRVQRGREQLKDLLVQCCRWELDRHGGVVDYQPRTTCPVCGSATATPSSCTSQSASADESRSQ